MATASKAGVSVGPCLALTTQTHYKLRTTGPISQAYAVPAHEQGAATRAFELARRPSQIAGDRPETPEMALAVRCGSTSLDDEAADLSTLAKWWTPAYAATEQATLMDREMNTS